MASAVLTSSRKKWTISGRISVSERRKTFFLKSGERKVSVPEQYRIGLKNGHKVIVFQGKDRRIRWNTLKRV